MEENRIVETIRGKYKLASLVVVGSLEVDQQQIDLISLKQLYNQIKRGEL